MILMKIELETDEPVEAMQEYVESCFLERDISVRVVSVDRIVVPICSSEGGLDPLDRHERRLDAQRRNRRVKTMLREGRR